MQDSPFIHPSIPRCLGLLSRARGLLPAEPELAVLLAQTAVEIYVEVSFDALLGRQVADELVRERLITLIRDRSLKGDDRTRRLWESLTGANIKQAATWKDYDRHVERRNLVVHTGEQVSLDDAESSVASCEGLIDHMQDELMRIFFDG